MVVPGRLAALLTILPLLAGCGTGDGSAPHSLVIDGLFVEPLQPEAGQSAALSVLVRDSDEHAVEVDWTVSGGALATATGFGAVWETPDTSAAYRVDVVARDLESPEQASATLFVPVVPVPIVMEPGDTAPIITAFTADTDFMNGGDSAMLCVEASDVDGDPLEYSWTFPPGIVEPLGTCATYVAFTGACLPGEYPFVVRVHDGRGGFAEATLFIWIDAGL